MQARRAKWYSCRAFVGEGAFLSASSLEEALPHFGPCLLHQCAS